LRVYTYYS